MADGIITVMVNARADEVQALVSEVGRLRAALAFAEAELIEWRELRDPVTLHVRLLHGQPAQLDRATFLHCAGATELLAACKEAESVLRRVGCDMTADLCAAALRPNIGAKRTPAALGR